MSDQTTSAIDGAGDFAAYVARPTANPHTAIVVIHEVFGWIRASS